MLKKRTNCPISCWLDLFGDRWTLLIIRDMLIFEKKTYKDFLESDEKISTNILADRLKKLVEQGVATKSVHPDNRLVFVYELTERGKSLEPVIMEIVKWSNAFLPETFTFKDLEKKRRSLG